MRAVSPHLPRAARTAVTLLFFCNGALFANWVPRIPEVKDALGLGEAALGIALLGAGVGGLVGSFAAGPVIARLGSRTASVAGAIALGVVLPLPGIAPSWAALGLAMVALGLADAAMDVAMNAHGVEVQRRYPRPILNAFHGWWGLGAATGAVTGSVIAAAGVSVATHLAATGLLGALACVMVRTRLLPSDSDRTVSGPRLVRPGGIVLLLGLLTAISAFIEDTPASWSAVYLNDELGVPAGAAGAAFAAFTISLTGGRLVADRLVDRFGTAPVARAGGIVAAVGLGTGLAVGGVVPMVLGFAAVGLGVGPLFPAGLGAAGALPGYPPGSAIAMVSLIARIGFLVGPPLIGGLAELVGLGTALWTCVGASVLAALLSGVLRAPAAAMDRPAT